MLGVERLSMQFSATSSLKQKLFICSFWALPPAEILMEKKSDNKGFSLKG